MTADQAAAFCKEAWPGRGVTVRSIKGTCEVVDHDGTTMGKAFSWRPAVQMAYKPYLDEGLKKQAEAWEAAQRDAKLFVEFLKQKFDVEFTLWKQDRNGSGNKSADVAGAEADQTQLVQVDAAEERSGPADPPRLVLTGRE